MKRGVINNNKGFVSDCLTTSQMPRHLISDAHEWINEIPSVPVCYPAKPQPSPFPWLN